jgi:hypothetical protein
VLFHQIDDRFDFFDVFGIQRLLLFKAKVSGKCHSEGSEESLII